MNPSPPYCDVNSLGCAPLTSALQPVGEDDDDIYSGIPYVASNFSTVLPPHILSMSRIYKTADDAGCPKYLVDEMFSVIRQEQINGCLDICDPNITKRESF